MDIPTELLTLMLDYLRFDQLCQSRRVSRRWREIGDYLIPKRLVFDWNKWNYYFDLQSKYYENILESPIRLPSLDPRLPEEYVVMLYYYYQKPLYFLRLPNRFYFNPDRLTPLIYLTTIFDCYDIFLEDTEETPTVEWISYHRQCGFHREIIKEIDSGLEGIPLSLCQKSHPYQTLREIIFSLEFKNRLFVEQLIRETGWPS